MSVVLDCSFTSRALIPTQLLPSALDQLERLLTDRAEFIVPYLLQAEFASALRQLEARRALDRDDAAHAWSDLLRLPIDYRWNVRWVERASEIAAAAGLSKVYDSIYLACAEAYGFELYTCDARFCRALGRALPPFVRLVAS